VIYIADSKPGQYLREEIMSEPTAFYESILAAGAILSGFCGTFLSFRIQREANYYRQPAVSFEEEKAKDIYVGLTHFTSSFFILSLGTICSVVFGFLLPLFALAGAAWLLSHRNVVVAGLVAALILVATYFIDEMIHYGILRRGRLLRDVSEWQKEIPVVVGGLAVAVVTFMVVMKYFQ
jgi:hypothetical protein